MTIPSEEVRAVEQTRELLRALATDRGYRPGWKELRRRCLFLLRHYPWQGKMAEVYQKAGEDLWPLKGEKK